MGVRLHNITLELSNYPSIFSPLTPHRLVSPMGDGKSGKKRKSGDSDKNNDKGGEKINPNFTPLGPVKSQRKDNEVH